ncbi:MAG: mechanosensitive ion channel family protein [Gemmatimonadales bacterium]
MPTFELDWAKVTAEAASVLLVLLVAWVAVRVLKLLTRRIEKAVDDGDPTTLTEREQRGKTLAHLLNSVGIVAIAVGAILTILNLFIAIAPLLAGVGVAGLAISFGAQSLVKDIIAGFFILLENQFGVDDIVEINGVAGKVERMTLRIVMLRDLHGVLHIIPNGSINMVSNRTRGFARSVVDVGVAYKTNIDHALRVLQEVAEDFAKDPDWEGAVAQPPKVLGVDALADSAVTIRMLTETAPGRQWDVSRELRRRIKNRLDAEGIEIPFPQRTLHFGDQEPLLSALRRRPEA